MDPEKESALPGKRELSGSGYTLWCRLCMRSLPFGIESLKTFEESGWPRCCDEVMNCGLPLPEAKG